MSYDLKSSIGYQTNLVATILKTSFTKLIQPKFGVAAEQFGTLKIINDEQKVTQTKIAELLGKDKTTVGRSIESLIKKNLLKREDCVVDKRANRVTLTSKGKKILEGANEIGYLYNEGLKQKISEEELKIYFKVINIILQESKNIELSIEKGELK